MSDLSTIPDSEFRAEVSRRSDLKIRQDEEARKKEELAGWRQRKPCPVIGLAYGSPDHYALLDANLCKVMIAGNMSWIYPGDIQVAPAVQTYFHNAWTRDDSEEFASMIKEVVHGFIDKKMRDPLIVTTLICLSSRSNNIPEVRKSLHEEALKRLCAYNLNSLSKALAMAVLKGETANGQDRLLREAITRKEKRIHKRKAKLLPGETIVSKEV